MHPPPSTASDAPGAPPGRGWRIAFLMLCTVGACLSADLLRLHVNVHTDPHYQSYCAMSERVNCETVAASGWAVFLGLPVAVWGLMGYLVMGGLAIWGLRGRLRWKGWPFGGLFVLTAISASVSLVLGLASHFVIKSVCIVCGGTYLVNLLLVVAALMVLRRAEVSAAAALREDVAAARRGLVPVAVFAATAGVVAATVWVSVPAYWKVERTTGPSGLPVGISADGHHWIGARSPRLTITEYSDYQCPYCQRGHAAIRALVAENPDSVRLEHRHYPLDLSCNAMLSRPMHVHACAYAKLATCAGQQKRFWEANDYLFEQGRREQAVSPTELAQAIGVDVATLQACLASDAPTRVVEGDLRAGQALNIRGTPTFVVNGQVYPGRIPPDVIDEALGRAPQRTD